MHHWVFRLDPAVALIIGFVNGQRTPEDIAALTGEDIGVETVLECNQ
jgi:hypothetical protein